MFVFKKNYDLKIEEIEELRVQLERSLLEKAELEKEATTKESFIKKLEREKEQLEGSIGLEREQIEAHTSSLLEKLNRSTSRLEDQIKLNSELEEKVEYFIQKEAHYGGEEKISAELSLENSQLKDELNAKNVRVSELEETVKAFKEQLEGSRRMQLESGQKIDEISQINKNLKGQLEEFKDETNKKNCKIDDLKSEIEKFSLQLKESEKELELRGRKIVLLSDEVDKSKGQLEELSKKNSLLRDNLIESESTLTEQRNELKFKTEEGKTLKENLREVLSGLDNVNNQNSVLSQSLAKKEVELKGVQKELAETLEKYEAVEKTKAEIEARVKDIDLSQPTVEELEGIIKENNLEFAKQGKEREDLKQLLEKRNKSLFELEEIRATSESIISENLGTINQLKSEVEKLSTDKDSIAEELKAITSNFNTLEKEKDILSVEKLKLTNKVIDLKAKLEDKENKNIENVMVSLKSQVEELNKKNQCLETEYNSYQNKSFNKIELLESQLKSTKVELEKTIISLDEKVKGEKFISRELDSVIDDLTQEKKKNKDLVTLQLSLSKEIEIKNLSLKSLQEELNLEKENKEKLKKSDQNYEEKKVKNNLKAESKEIILKEEICIVKEDSALKNKIENKNLDKELFTKLEKYGIKEWEKIVHIAKENKLSKMSIIILMNLTNSRRRGILSNEEIKIGIDYLKELLDKGIDLEKEFSNLVSSTTKEKKSKEVIINKLKSETIENLNFILKSIKDYELEDWLNIYKFENKYRIFSPKENQRLNNILSRLKLKLPMNSTILSHGEQCLKKALNNGFELYLLSVSQWEVLIKWGEDYEIIKPMDISFLKSVLRYLRKHQALTKDQLVRSKLIYDDIKEAGCEKNSGLTTKKVLILDNSPITETKEQKKERSPEELDENILLDELRSFEYKDWNRAHDWAKDQKSLTMGDLRLLRGIASSSLLNKPSEKTLTSIMGAYYLLRKAGFTAKPIATKEKLVKVSMAVPHQSKHFDFSRLNGIKLGIKETIAKEYLKSLEGKLVNQYINNKGVGRIIKKSLLSVKRDIAMFNLKWYTGNGYKSNELLETLEEVLEDAIKKSFSKGNSNLEDSNRNYSNSPVNFTHVKEKVNNSKSENEKGTVQKEILIQETNSSSNDIPDEIMDILF
jgi:hypothetical protein